MFTTERFFSKIWGGWFFTIMVSALTLLVGPKLLAAPMLIASVINFFWCLKCAYRSERFSDYATFRLYFVLSLGPALAFLTLLTSTYTIGGWHWLPSLALSVLPLLLFLLIYFLVRTAKSKFEPFALVGDKVFVHEPPQSNPIFLVGLSTGLLSLIYPLMETSEAVIQSILVLAMICLFYGLYHFRAHIVSLKSLKEREHRENRYYTFQDIEHIREIRRTSFLGRLFAPKNKN